jgi:hypothetical protein
MDVIAPVTEKAVSLAIFTILELAFFQPLLLNFGQHYLHLLAWTSPDKLSKT